VLLSIAHETDYRYSGDAVESHMELRLRPSSGDGQIVVRHRLNVRPDAQVRGYVDGFGNQVQYFNLHQPHDRLEILSELTVETGLSQATETPGPEPFDFLLFRPPVTDTAGVRRLGRNVRLAEPNGPEEVEGAMERLMQLIAGNFRYTPDVTTVTTDVDEVLRKRRGVCQDFAHLLIAMSRTQGIPCRYVSGYVYAGSGEPVTGASHAWADAWIPGRGWKSYDPTHPGLSLDRYVRLAVGRDYRDAAPTRGVYTGSARSDMEVRVDISPLAPHRSSTAGA
jgi:transglutaminase-like putative cysteine protease